jgi:cell division septation protein DedD
MGQPVEFAGLPSGEELAKSWEANAASYKRSGAWAWVSLFVLLASLAAFAVINQDRVLQEWENMRAYLSGAKPAAESTEDTSPSAAPVPPPPSVSMSSSTTPVVKPVEALNPDKEELVVPASPDPAPAATTPAPAVTPPTPAASAPAVTEPAKAEPPKAELAAPAVVVPAKKSDKAKEADNPNWVAQLDPNAWVMQHGAFDSLSEARQFQSTSLGFKSGQVLFTQRKGSKPYYILLTGPYADKAQAQALMKDNPLLAKAWLRSAKSLQLQFQD